MVPHPGLQIGDVVTVNTDHVDGLPCVIDKLTLPYTPAGGAMFLDVRVI